MPVITIKNLVAKNSAGNGLRNDKKGNNPTNNAAVRKLADLLRKAGPIVAESNEALQFACDEYAASLETLATTSVNANTRGMVSRALNVINGFDGLLNNVDGSTKLTAYETIVQAMPSVGSSKEEFDALLGTANGVLELGLEKTILKPFDPKEAERQRQEQERQRQEQELLRREAERRRQEQERLRQEAERQRQEQLRQRQEQERRRQEQERLRQEAERRRQEQERLRQEAERLREEQERQRRADRVNAIKKQREDFLKEDYIGTDYEDGEVRPLQVDTERYSARVERERAEEAAERAAKEAERVAGMPNILEDQREQVEQTKQSAEEEKLRAQEKDERLNDPLNTRRRDKEDAELLAEEEAKNTKPLVQRTVTMISQKLKDSFLERYPDSEELTAQDINGRKLVGTEAILEALSDDVNRPRLYIDIPGDPERRCMCLQGEKGKLLISNGPVQQGDLNAELHIADPEDLKTEFTRFCAEKGIESAVGKDGTVYTKKEDMFRALEEQDRLMLFGKDMEFAIGVLRQGETLHATEKAEQQKMGSESVSPDRLPEKTMLFGLKDDDILYAVTDEGTRLESAEDIRKEIRSGKGLLRVHTAQDRENPYVIDYERGQAAITKYPVYEGQIGKLTEADFETCLPEEIEEKYILNWKEDEIDYAVDANGKQYRTPQEIKTALYGADKTLQLYTRSKEGGEAHALPFAVEKRNNRFYISKERVPKFEDQMSVLGEQLSEMDEEDFAQVYRHENARDFLGKNFTNGTAHRIDFAVDDKGNLFDSVEKIAGELERSEERTLYIYDKTGELPYAVRKKDGIYYKSSDRISTQTIMPETMRFEPKRSLHPDVLGDRTDATAYWDYSTEKDKAGGTLKHFQKEVERLTELKKKGPPNSPKDPVKPRLGGWNTFVRGLKKIVTFGLGGETQAYKTYTDKKKKYEEDLRTLPERRAKFEADKKKYEALDQLLAEAEAGVSKAQEKLNSVKAELEKASGGLDRDSADHSKREVVKYRNRTEAKLEGLQDLKNSGKITPENIFAYTWLKEAECRGKAASDPEARKALCAFIAANSVQNDILNHRFQGTAKSAQTSDALDQRKVSPLNTGKAVEALMRDEDLKKLLDRMGSEPIDPGYINRRYSELVAAREAQARRESVVYKKARETMEREFGEQELSEQALDEVMRYKLLQRAIDDDNIQVYDSAPKGLATIFGTKPTEEEKKPYRDAFNALKSQGKGPMGLREMTESLDNKKRELEMERESEALNNEQPQLS